MTTLVVAPCERRAAEYAVLHWHYSKVMPTGKMVTFGAWEDDRFVGAVVFSRGASPHLGNAFQLDQTEVCELTRVALTEHASPVSAIVARAIRRLSESSPGLRLIVSFADPMRGHHGGIYQAGNWIYTGQSNPVTEYLISGRWRHTRGAYWHPQRATAPRRQAPGKHRYLYPLDRGMRRRVERIRLPYPPTGLASEPQALPRSRAPG